MNPSQHQIIKQHLLQLTASLVDSSPLQHHEDSRAPRHDTVALFSEQILDLSFNEKAYDMYVLKPFIKAFYKITQSRLAEIESDLNNTKDDSTIKGLVTLQKTYEGLNFYLMQLL